MKKRRCGTLCILVVCLLLISGIAHAVESMAALAFSSLIGEVNGSYVTRNIDVDQTTGNIYAAVDAASTTVKSQVVKVGPDGAVLARYGNIIYDSANNQITDIQQDLWGVALDPKTGYLYLGTDENATGSNVGTVYTIDPNDATQPGVYKGQIITDGVTARGVAISDDGMKLAVAGYTEQLPGNCGAKLYTRNLNGTPEWTDDTWDFAANLVTVGGLRGLGDYNGFEQSPRDVEFDRNGDVYLTGGYSIYKYSGTAPYKLIEEFFNYSVRWSCATDADNNLYTVYGADPDKVARIWCVNQSGYQFGNFSPDNVFGSQMLDSKYCIGYDRFNGRIIVAGRNMARDQAVLESYLLYPDAFTPFNVTVHVTDKVTGAPIPNASVGAVKWVYSGTTWVTRLVGKKWHSAVTDANGDFVMQVLNELSPGGEVYPVIMDVEAPNYLRQRVHGVRIAGDMTVNVEMVSSTVDSITWNAPEPPVTGLWNEKNNTESGLIHYTWRFGGRAEMAYFDAVAQTDPCMEIGDHPSAPPAGVSKAYDNYLFFDLDDNWITPGSDAWVTIEYMDKAADTGDALGIDADYSSVDPVWTGVNVGTIWKHDTVTPTWKTRTFKLQDVGFANGIKGFDASDVSADLRIDAFRDFDPVARKLLPNTGKDWIKSVTISKNPPATPEPNTYNSIVEAKAAGLGRVVLPNEIITAGYGCYDTTNFGRSGNVFYIGDPDRTSGIKVVSYLPIWLLDQRVGRNCVIYGDLKVDDLTGEPYIQADGYEDDPFVLPPAIGSLGMTSYTLNALNLGPNLTGLKVRTWGTVTAVNQPASFTINDGSGDVTVEIDTGLNITWPSIGNMVTVEGIASLTGSEPSTAVRAIKPWMNSVNIITP